MLLMVNVIAQLLIRTFRLEINKVLEMEEEEETSVIDLHLRLILVNKLDNKGKYYISN